MPRYYFQIELAGEGDDLDAAWRDAFEAFSLDPGCMPDEYRIEHDVGESPFNPGDVVSSATLRPQDLLKRFRDALLCVDPSHARLIIGDEEFQKLRDMLEKDPSSEWAREEADFTIDLLEGALNYLAPEGCYFGSHVGDGACFGFWSAEDLP